MSLVDELEPDLEALLLRIVPDLADQWQGATEQEIEKIEKIAGRELPRFYRWFLMRMGRSMGPMTYPSLDFSASKVISSYAEDRFQPHPRFLMIGYESDDEMPIHMMYDFDHPARDDARVAAMQDLDETLYNQFDTFREMLAWGEFCTSRVEKFSTVCIGSFVDDGDGDVLSQLDPIMDSLGFKAPISTGACCSIYDHAEAAMVTSSTPGDEPRIHLFRLGGADVGSLRKLLGTIADQTGLEVEIEEWDQPGGS
ncbi:MAG: SMI1/KNR4 family protein [Myxococcota bacterium]